MIREVKIIIEHFATAKITTDRRYHYRAISLQNKNKEYLYLIATTVKTFGRYNKYRYVNYQLNCMILLRQSYDVRYLGS